MAGGRTLANARSNSNSKLSTTTNLINPIAPPAGLVSVGGGGSSSRPGSRSFLYYSDPATETEGEQQLDAAPSKASSKSSSKRDGTVVDKEASKEVEQPFFKEGSVMADGPTASESEQGNTGSKVTGDVSTREQPGAAANTLEEAKNHDGMTAGETVHQSGVMETGYWPMQAAAEERMKAQISTAHHVHIGEAPLPFDALVPNIDAYYGSAAELLERTKAEINANRDMNALGPHRVPQVMFEQTSYATGAYES